MEHKLSSINIYPSSNHLNHRNKTYIQIAIFETIRQQPYASPIIYLNSTHNFYKLFEKKKPYREIGLYLPP